ncbi:hypothetical protein [Candidatus Deianiraea vastatrix]|uniref:Uncharacterized protein n=1 Tax=Candidatus Deianiraea vastatrix TaxID=2163644 RepID=A0A5B8XG91_9RICK|nr:hypothetical protein [Candidatus Deianiraea vastatrix]QED23334.1 hypothetical protein Deia_00539 [Candidatus Deianiraea vastatrix]
MINFTLSCIKKILNMIKSASKLVILIILIICVSLGFLFYTANQNLKHTIDKWYNADDKDGETPYATKEDSCTNVKILAKYISDFYSKIISGGDVSANFDVICKNFNCSVNEEITANKFLSLKGSNKMSELIDNIMKNLQTNIQKKEKLKIRKHIYIFKKTDFAEDIQNRHKFMQSLYILRKQIQDLEYSNAISTISSIEASSFLHEADFNKIKSIKQELEHVIIMKEILEYREYSSNESQD